MAYQSAPQNMITHYGDTNRGLRIRSLGEKVFMCDVNETLFIRALGGLNTAPGKFGIRSVTDDRLEWQSDGEIPIADTLAAPISAPVSLGNDGYGNAVYANEDWTVTNVGYFMPGMVLEMPLPASAYTPGAGSVPEKEKVWVSEVTPGTSTLTVVRGFGGTPVYAYLAAHPVCINSTAALERQTWAANYVVRRSANSNVFQIFYAGLGKTKKSDRLMKNYGDEGSEYNRQMARIMGGSVSGKALTGQLPMQLEMATMYGVKQEGNENIGLPSSFGGVTSFDILKPVYPDWTFERMQTIMQTLFQNGATTDIMIVSPDVKRVISQWAEHRNYNAGREDRGFGVTVDTIETDFGKVGITMHRKMNKGEIFLLETPSIGLYQGWEFEETELPIPNSSLYSQKMIDGCYSLALACENHHAWIRIDNAAFYEMACQPGAVGYTEPALSARTAAGVVA